jgi:hypothetical protein
MAHHETNEHLSPVEIEFRDVMQHADDFLKIELLRPAKNRYQKALSYNIEVDKVEQKIAECNRLISFEQKIIWVVVALAAVIVTVIILSN